MGRRGGGGVGLVWMLCVSWDDERDNGFEMRG